MSKRRDEGRAAGRRRVVARIGCRPPGCVGAQRAGGIADEPEVGDRLRVIAIQEVALRVPGAGSGRPT